MSDPAAAAAASPSAKKVVDKKSKAKPVVRKGPKGPTYSDMAVAAIVALKGKRGSSRPAILKYLQANNKVGDNARKLLNTCLAKGLKSGVLIHPPRAPGCYKLADKPKVRKEKVTARKVKKGKSKTKAPKKAKKPAAAKKPANKPKKKAAKKATKPVAKKPAAKKAKKAPKKKAQAKKAPANKVAKK